MAHAKFVQIEAVVDGDSHMLYALDEGGVVWWPEKRGKE